MLKTKIHKIIALYTATALFFTGSCGPSGTKEQSKPADSLAAKEDTSYAARMNSDTTLNPLLPRPLNASQQYAYLSALKRRGDHWTCEADFLDFYYGEKATEVARKRGDAIADTAKDGTLSWWVPNNYYIVNDDKTRKTLTLHKDARIYTIDYEDELKSKKIHPDSLIKTSYMESRLFVLTLSGDEITAVKQQYIP